MKTVLIAGCGYIGNALATLLLSDGVTNVFGLKRHPDHLPRGVRPLAADLTKEISLDILSPFSADFSVVFAASAGAHTEEAYSQTYLLGVQNLLTALRALPCLPRRFVFVSSTSIYGDAAGAIVTEKTPPVPDAFPGRIMLQAEELIRASGINSVSMRFGGIYGPERWRLAEQVQKGEGVLLPEGGPISNRIHRDDGAAALLHVLKLPRPEQIYLVVDNEPTAHNDILHWMASRSGSTLISGASAQTVSRQLRGNKRCSNQMLRQTGFQFRYPSYKEGFAEFFASNRS